MDIHITFPGGKGVDAQVGRHVVRTDQPAAQGGRDEAPAPFDLFLASLGTCAGIYVLGFCQARGLSTEGIALTQRNQVDAAGHLARVELELALPPEFPEKYRVAVARAAEGCKVKKTLAAPPEIVVRTLVGATGHEAIAAH
jgi:ribosomal protein S12 methylthiotransferase accessory factor